MQWEVWFGASLQKAYMREDEDGDVMTPDEEEDGTPKISLHAITAITGNGPTETMKTYGRIGWSNLLVLIDSGNTHNFMSLSLARVLKLQLGEEGGMDVTITPQGKRSAVQINVFKFQ